MNSIQIALVPEQEAHHINEVPLEEQACALGPDVIKEQDSRITRAVQKLQIIKEEQTLVKTVMGHGPKNMIATKFGLAVQKPHILPSTSMKILKPRLETFGMTIEKDTIILGDPLDIEELETLSSDEGIKRYINNSYESGAIRKPIMETPSRVIHFTVSKYCNGELNNNIYLSTLNAQMLDLSSLDDNQTKKHALMFKSMIPKTIAPRISRSTYYTDIITGFFIINGRYDYDTISQMTSALKEAFFQSVHNRNVARRMQPYVSTLQLQAVKVLNEPNTYTKNKELTYTIMTMTLNLPHKIRKILLRDNYIRPLSLQIGSEIATSAAAKAICEIRLNIIKDTIKPALHQNKYYYMCFNTLRIYYYFDEHDNHPYKKSEILYNLDTNSMQQRIVLKAYSVPKSLNAQTALQEALTQQRAPAPIENQSSLFQYI